MSKVLKSLCHCRRRIALSAFDWLTNDRKFLDPNTEQTRGCLRENLRENCKMAVATTPPTTTATAFLNTVDRRISLANSPPLRRLFPAKKSSRIFAMAPKKKVNKYDKGWKKEWFGAGLFFEGSEEIEVDVFKKLEKRKVLSNVEKAGLLSKAEELGLTLSSIEKLGILSKAEELGLLSLLETAAGYSPAALASAALPVLVAAILAVVFIPDDSTALVVVQTVIAGTLAATAGALFVGSIVLDGLQEAD